MSRGTGAHAKKVLEDDETVIYEYGGYNLNEPEYRNENHILDGTITIRKSCFIEPEIHEFYIFLRHQEQGDIPEIISYNE